MLVYTFYRQIYSFLLGINLGVELLGHHVGICLPLVKIAKGFFIVVVPFKSSPAMHKGASCFIPP